MLRVWCHLHKVVEHRNSSIYFGDTFTCQKGINTCTGWAFDGMEKERNDIRKDTQRFLNCSCDVLFFLSLVASTEEFVTFPSLSFVFEIFHKNNF